MKMIATTGMGGSGKGEVLKYLETRGLKSVVMRTVVENEMRENGIEVNNKNLREYATELRKKNGMDIVAKMCLPLLKEMSKEKKTVLIDGIRSYEEVELFKREFGDDFVLIAVFASLKLRFERLKKRGEEWDMKTVGELEWRDKKELSWGTGNSIALSDFIIDNSGTLKDLQKKVDEVLEKITG